MSSIPTHLPASVESLQKQNLLWSANRTPAKQELVSTGYAELDDRLQGGYPTHGVVEISSAVGIGELRLLMPYLKTQSEHRLCVLINPPEQINSHAFRQLEINHDNLIIITHQEPTSALWAAEQALKSGCCGAVLLWQQELEIHQAKRLQVASEQGQCLQFLLKQPQANALSLPISLCLQLTSDSHGVNVMITKRKGGFSRTSFTVPMQHYWPQLTTYKQTQQSAEIFAFPPQQKRYAHQQG